MCIVKVKASSKLSENVCILANIVVADPNILLYKPQQYILSHQQQPYPSASQYATSTNISHR